MGLLARPDDAHHTGDAGDIRRGVLVDGRFDVGLYIGIQRRLDQISALGDLLLADTGPCQVVQRVVAEEGAVPGRDASARQLVGRRQHAEWFQLGRAQRLGFLRHVLDHGVQHQVPPGQRTLGVGVGVQHAGRLNHAGQQRGLLPVELGGVDPEVGLGGVLDTEGAVTEGHQVQVPGQDLRFGERLVQRQRHPDLAQLAGRGGLDGRALLGVGLGDHQQLIVLHVLLLDGGAATGVQVAGEITGQAGQRALPVHTVVLGEPFVLDRDDGQLHGVGDLIGGHLEAALRVQPGDRVAAGVGHRRHRRDVALDQLRRSVGDHIGGPVGHQAYPADDREHQSGGDDGGQQTAPHQFDDRHRYRGTCRGLLRHELQSSQRVQSGPASRANAVFGALTARSSQKSVI
ncbi:hypothetical protein MYFR107205_20690 [Mycolicibacterium frederiksbergense]